MKPSLRIYLIWTVIYLVGLLYVDVVILKQHEISNLWYFIPAFLSPVAYFVLNKKKHNKSKNLNNTIDQIIQHKFDNVWHDYLLLIANKIEDYSKSETLKTLLNSDDYPDAKFEVDHLLVSKEAEQIDYNIKNNLSMFGVKINNRSALEMAKLTVDNVLSAFIMELETNSLNVNHNWPEIVYCMESIDANRALSKYSEETIKTARVIIKYYDGLLAIKGVFGCYLGKFNPFEPFKMNKKRPRRINHVINNCCFFDNALMIPNGTKGFIEYWEKYGTEGFFKSLIINGLAKQSRQIGIMEIFGRFPEENMTFCITKSFNGRPQAEIDEAIADGLKALNDIENGNYK